MSAKKPVVAVGACLRNASDYMGYYRAAMCNQIGDGQEFELVFSLLEGDSTDDTLPKLQSWAAEDPRVVLTKKDLGHVDNFDDRVRLWADLCNAVIDAVAGRDYDYLLWCESDLCFPSDLVQMLLASQQDVVAPAIFLGGLFYDSWGFRGTDGNKFVSTHAIHPSYKPFALFPVNSVGSVVLFSRKVLDAGIRFRGVYENGLLVGMCNEAREKGFGVYCDSRVSVIHPTSLWQRGQYTMGVVEIAGLEEEEDFAGLLRQKIGQILAKSGVPTMGQPRLPAGDPFLRSLHAALQQQFPGRTFSVATQLHSETPRRYALVCTVQTPVALDISVLGFGQLDQRARTGVYRYVECLLRGLAQRDDVQLHLVSHVTALQSSREFVQAREDLRQRFIVEDLRSAPAGAVLHSPFYALPASAPTGPRLLTVHDLIPFKFPQWFAPRHGEPLRNALKSLRASDTVLVNSTATAADLMASAPELVPGLGADAVVVTPLAADADMFHPCDDAAERQRVRSAYGLPAHGRYLLSVATLEPRKNIAHLVRAFVQLRKEDGCQDLRLVLVGAKGWKFDAVFDELALAADTREYIVLTGFVPDEDMAALYSQALAFVYPSLYEGFGLPPLEAMRCGTPVITSDNSSLPEVVGDAGMLVPAQDEAALVAAMRALCTDEARRQDLAAKSLARAANFTWERCVSQTLSAYRRALAQWQARPAAAGGTIVVDAVFFQMYQTGIARVWRTLLREWAQQDFGRRLVVLDRGRTAPRFNGLRYVDMPRHDYAQLDADRAALQRVCDAENAAVFISSYCTAPLTTATVFMAHDMIPELMGVDLSTPMWREKQVALHQAKRFVAVSRNTARDLRRFLPQVGDDRIAVAHCGVDFRPPAPQAVAALRAAHGIDRPYFLQVGARGSYKNNQLFFQAFAALGDERARYAIVCTGPVPQLEAEFAAHVGPAKVHLLQLDDDALQAAYGGALALVYPSLYEGFGMPVAEAMACGCPVITCRSGSIPEVAGEAALYVGTQDVAAMADALRRVQEPVERARLVAAGQQQARAFSWRQMADQVRAVLEDTAAQTQPPVATREQLLGTALKHHQVNELPQAEAIYRQLLGQSPNDFVALHLLGVAQFQRGDLATAEQLLQRALAINDVTPQAHFNMGNVRLAQGRLEEARACYQRCLALDPSFTPAQQQLQAVAERMLSSPPDRA